MIRIFQRLGCCNPSPETLVAEERQVSDGGQETLGPVSKSSEYSNISAKLIVTEDCSGNSSTGIGTASRDAQLFNNNKDTRTIPLNPLNVKSQDPEYHSDRSTIRAAMFEKAHNFNIENAPITNIGVNINHQHVNSHGNFDTLEKFVAFSALHDSSAQDPERCCHPDTRKVVLNQIRGWADDPTRPERILWLHGPAVGATFFFFRSDPIRNDGNRLFPTLAWQLVLSAPIIKDLIAVSLQEYPDLPRKAVEVQFNKFISHPFLAISGGESTTSASTRVIIIDGLDECSDVKLQDRILKVLGEAVANNPFPLRFLISSRPEANIQDFFDQFQHPTLRIDLANVEDAFRDIKTYLTSEFTRIAVEQHLDPTTWPAKGIVDSLVLKSSGQFVYASTVMKYVGDKYESAVAQLDVVLGLKPSNGKSPFSELDTLYIEILQRQPDQNFLKEFLPVLVARSSMTGVKSGTLHEDDAMLLGLDVAQLHRKLRGMHSVLKFEPFIDVHHKSFLDFLDGSSRSGEYHISKHFAHRRYLQRITDLIVETASRAMKNPDSHEGVHFQPGFAAVIRHFPLEIELSLDDLEEFLQPLQIIQETLLRLPNMSIPWKPRACEECWTFYMINDLLLHLTILRRTIQSQASTYVSICPLTAIEKKQSIPELDLDTCLSSLLINLESIESLMKSETVGLARALVRFDPVETAMKVRSMTDAQNLVEFIFCLNKNKCFKSWFGETAHNATRLALAMYGRVPLLPRSLFLDTADIDDNQKIYQGKAVEICDYNNSVWRDCFSAFAWGSLFHNNMVPLIGINYFQSSIMEVSPPPGEGTLREWRKTNTSVPTIQLILFEVAKAIRYIHSLCIVLCYLFDMDDVFLYSNNHIELRCPIFQDNDVCKVQFDYGYNGENTELTLNILSFGRLFHEALFDEDYQGVRPEKPEIPDNLWQLIVRCCATDPTERPTMDQVVQEMESWISFGQFTVEDR